MTTTLALLDVTGAKSRYSVAFINAVCAHAGLTFLENPPDSDGNALDGRIDLGEFDVRVQIKCTSKAPLRDGSYSISLEESWITKWCRSRTAVFLILIVVPRGQHDWIEYQQDQTVHRAQGYWAKFNPTSDRKSIRFESTNRFTVETLSQWHAEQCQTGFGEEAT